MNATLPTPMLAIPAIPAPQARRREATGTTGEQAGRLAGAPPAGAFLRAAVAWVAAIAAGVQTTVREAEQEAERRVIRAALRGARYAATHLDRTR